MKYSKVLNDLKGYYEIKETINIINKDVGLNGVNLLILLHIMEGYDSYSKLVWVLSINRSLISRSVIGMEKKGVLKRVLKKNTKNISLTVDGEELLRKALNVYEY